VKENIVPIKLSNEEFIERSIKIHGNIYDYSITNYVGCKTKVKIICCVHGIFEAWASDHMRGVGCSKCYFNSNILTTDIFIERAKLVHNKNYDYSNVDYLRHDLYVKIICFIHGEFNQKPCHHLTGRGCRKCFVDGMKISSEDLLKQMNNIHNNKYSYDLSNYINAKSFIKITCPIHKEFMQKAGNHFNGEGCPKCYKNISKSEISWLDSLNIDEKYRNKVIRIDGKRYNLDAYDPISNTVYEFYGDYWHGNPKIFDSNKINVSNKKTFGALYNNTINRENILKNNGYNIISIWEYDFRLKQKEINNE